MKHFIILFAFSFLSFYTADDSQRQVISKNGISIPVYHWDEFEELLHYDNDTVYVINFWATWCGPCVKELPQFEKLYDSTQSQAVKIILVDLDLKSTWETKLIDFLIDRNIRSKVVILHEPDANSWIPKIDSTWTGAIPSTMIYKGNDRKFIEGVTNYSKLKSYIADLNN